MTDPLSLAQVVGTNTADVITIDDDQSHVTGLAGNDTINGGKSNDIIYGDYTAVNLLSGVTGATSFAQYGETGSWTIGDEPNGHLSMTQSIDTQAGEKYTLNFELAANFASGTTSGAVQVLWNNDVIGSFVANSASFSTHEVSFAGVAGLGELTIRSIDGSSADSATIHTDGPAFYYDKEVSVGGQTTTVKAFAEAQSNFYQVINGTLQIFDVVTSTYVKAGSDATVTINGIGFNIEDDLIYGIAVGDGVDSLGNVVSKSDLMMIDAAGDSYRVGASPYRSWTADFDDKGNLWAFHSSMDRITLIDVDQIGADGVVASTTFKFPTQMITDQLWDVAYNSETQTFAGVTRPSAEGAAGLLYEIDVSGVAAGGEPEFRTLDVTSTVINGEVKSGIPLMTFGASFYDADGTLYVSGNSGDHDMDDSTASAGGVYRAVTDEATGDVQLQLIASGPSSSSNDGTADPRASDPFAEVDSTATVLIRQPTTGLLSDRFRSYDDIIENGQGADEAYGGFGADQIAGQSGDDLIVGGSGSDILFGGNSGRVLDTQIDHYDEDGNRFDENGVRLQDDADHLFGGDGADAIAGNAGNDTLDGGNGDDYLEGGSGLDVLAGGEGNDILAGGGENDLMYGGAGQDSLVGSHGQDTLYGDDGADRLRGGGDADLIEGGAGDDLLVGGVGEDELIGGSGADTLKGGSSNDRLTDLVGDNKLLGGSSDDVLVAGSGQDFLNGGSGSDNLSGGAARDTLKGGNGEDSLFGGAGNDKLYGGGGGDLIRGGDGNDRINAAGGDDTLVGGDGKDKIMMGAGSDVISGGASNDRFVFRAGDRDGSTDTIQDFTRSGDELDKLDLRLLNLDAGGVSRADWIGDHLSQAANGDITIDIGNLTVKLVDHNDLGDEFYAQVEDGIFL